MSNLRFKLYRRNCIWNSLACNVYTIWLLALSAIFFQNPRTHETHQISGHHVMHRTFDPSLTTCPTVRTPLEISFHPPKNLTPSNKNGRNIWGLRILPIGPQCHRNIPGNIANLIHGPLAHKFSDLWIGWGSNDLGIKCLIGDIILSGVACIYIYV